jgi:hypothetical protein
LQQAQDSRPVFANMLVTGFDGSQWPLWPLLHASVMSSAHATVVLEYPRDNARDLDQAWVGTWENAFGEAKPVSAQNQSIDSLFSEEEMRGTPLGKTKRSFLIGADTTQQSEAIAQQCLNYLADPMCTRLGIIFPRAGALPRLVTNALARMKIPHRDGLAQLIPGPFEADEWRAWLELQNNRGLTSLLRFINAFSGADELLAGLTSEQFERALRSAYAEVLIDDLDILKQFCVRSTAAPSQSVAKALDAIPFLPVQARLSDFLDATRAALGQLGWSARWLEISRYLGGWVERLNVQFSRALYLRWLNDIGYTFAASREPEGDHAYSRIELLTIPQACGQEWSHVIIAGLNDGSWPPPDAGEFVREDEIAALNRNTQDLNRRAIQEGDQGEGHVAVRANHTFYLGPREQRQIACRQFERLLESTIEAVTFTASLIQDDAPERFWNPSELFTTGYLEQRGQPLTQQAQLKLQAETERWIRDPNANGASLKKRNQPVRVAYDARRDPGRSSDEYDFAFGSKPSPVPTMSVSDFEKLVSAPALVWLRKYVGVKAADQNDHVWNTSSGKWVHDWLAAIAGGTERAFTAVPDASEIERRVCARAEQKRREITELCQLAGKPLPDWWTSGWRNALYIARVLAERVAAVNEWPWLAAEWTIEEGTIKAGADFSLRLRGRIDLILARAQPNPGSLATNELWIIDYKTGGKKPLSNGRQGPDGRRAGLKKRLLDGSALQLGFYALAAGSLGAKEVEVSLLSPVVRPLKPQISSANFASEMDIFAELARMQQTGIFGMRGPLRSNYRFTDDYPLATIAIDPDILEQRWDLTHPALVRDEEDWW